MMDTNIDYGQDQELAKQFFRDCTHVNEDGEILAKYGPKLTALANRDAIHAHIDLADVELFDHDLASKIVTNTHRYTQIFYDALDEVLPAYKTKDLQDKDIMDIFIEQRNLITERNQRNLQSNGISTSASFHPSQQNQPNSGRMTNIVDIDGKYPADLIRKHEIYFKPASLVATPIREVQSESVGHLVTVRGIVTRATDVKPKVTIVTYTCDQCGFESFQPVRGAEFTPLFECTSAACKSNKTLGRITMQTRGSKFVKYQEIKLQEHSDHVPTGHIPRTITVMAHGEITRSCVPGNHISVSGVFLPMDKTGFRMRSGGLTADTYIEAHYITQMNKTEDDELNIEPMTTEEAAEFVNSLGSENFLTKLSSSIAPEIYGHEQLKKALLLLLVGGVDRSPMGMKIRGNINICLMGDPGVAKSQLLSFIDRLASRSQYTTGRGSSGVGLTAAVLKDPITNELILEGGALVLADEGICCIDEFDKMMEADRTAIHEVMEQQTVSIAKAGIMTTLNARVSILAAANPAWGRYNIHRSITDNLQLPPALLSRFDLLWLIRDQPGTDKDLELAQHVTQIHRNPDEPQNEYDAIDMKVMRRYINLCKTKNPSIPEDLTERLVDIYLNIRARKRINSNEDALFTSPRSLLAIIRLSTAFARLRLADSVEEADIKAAVDLYNCSRESIEGSAGGPSSKVAISMIVDELGKDGRVIKLESVMKLALSRGFNEEQVMAALDALHQFETIEFRDEEIIRL